MDLTETTDRPRRADAIRNEARVRAAAEIIFLRRGKNLSMDEVAAEAGVSKGTVYNVFGSRDALLDDLTIAYLKHATASYRDAMLRDDLWAALVECILTPTMGVAATSDVMAPDAAASPVHEAWLECTSALDDLIAKLKLDGIVRPEIETGYLVNLFRGLYQVLPEYHERGIDYAIAHGTIILRGIRA